MPNLNEVSRRLRTSQSSRDWLLPAILLLIGAAFFAELLFTSKNLYFRDILNFHYPLRKLIVGMYSRGELPLWNPFVYFGQPLLANPNYLAFYPTNLLHLFLPFNYAFKLHFVLHPLLGGLGAYFLARRLGILRIAAFTGALSYQFSGVVLSFLNLYNIVPVVGLMPWLAWAFAGVVQRLSTKRLLVLSGVLALQVLALEPLAFQCEILFLVALSIPLSMEGGCRSKILRRSLAALAVAAIAAVALAAVQVLPTLELLPLAARKYGFSFEEHSLWSVHPLDLVNLFIPKLFGQYYTMANATSWGELIHAGREPYLVSFFTGTVSMVLVAVSFLSVRIRLQRTMAGMALLGIFMGLGSNNPIYHWLFDHVFFLQMGRYPSKYLLLSTLAIAVLVALGVEVVTNKGAEFALRRRGLKLIAAISLAGSVFLAAAWFAWHARPGDIETVLRSLDDPALVESKNYENIVARLQESVVASSAFAAVASLILLMASRRPPTSFTAVMFIGLLSAEVIPPNLGTVALVSETDMDFVPEINRYVQKLNVSGPFRLLPPTVLRSTPDLVLRTPNSSSAWVMLFYKASGQAFFGIEQGIQYSLDRSVDFLNTFESDQLVRKAISLSDSDRIALAGRLNTEAFVSLGPIWHPDLQFLREFPNISNAPTFLYAMKSRLDRAYFASGVIRASSQDEALVKLCDPGFDARQAVILEVPGPAQAPTSEGGSARVIAYESRRVECEVQARVPGWLVLSDSYYPGWVAMVDGQPGTISRANYAFRAVAVSPGTHRVDFLYKPRTFYWGLGVTISTIFVLINGCLFTLYRRCQRGILR